MRGLRKECDGAKTHIVNTGAHHGMILSGCTLEEAVASGIGIGIGIWESVRIALLLRGELAGLTEQNIVDLVALLGGAKVASNVLPNGCGRRRRT